MGVEGGCPNVGQLRFFGAAREIWAKPVFKEVELELRFSGNGQEILCALENICHSETPDKESFSCIAKFYKIDGEFLEAEQKMNKSFRRVCGLRYMTVSELLETMQKNDLVDMFPEFPNVVLIVPVIPATSCCAKRSFSALCILKT